MLWIQQLHSANWSLAGWICLSAYFLGCFTTGYYLVRVRTGQDPRHLGSGSVGAKNVGRVLGWSGFLVTLLGDFGKGAFAIWAARHFTTDQRLVSLAMLAVVAGHVWPAQLRFHGGKGVATSLGALLVYDYHLALAFAILFAGAFAMLRRTVLPGLFGFVCLPLVSSYLTEPTKDPSQVVGISILAALVLVAHRKNLMDEISHLVEQPDIQPKHNQSKL